MDACTTFPTHGVLRPALSSPSWLVRGMLKFHLNRAETSDEPQAHCSTSYPETIITNKKPSIAITAGPSTSTAEDVCPWDIIEPRSRKNSTQFDSGSSSSEISVAVAEVTEKLRRSCMLTQQHTVDGGKSSKKLSAASCSEPRRASVSVLPEVAPGCSSSSSASGDAEKTFKKSHSLTKACSVASTNPPIISVSSVADVEKSSEEKGEEAAAPIIVPMAPLAEPDSESPASEMPPELLEEAKSNDVCPWEDE